MPVSGDCCSDPADPLPLIMPTKISVLIFYPPTGLSDSGGGRSVEIWDLTADIHCSCLRILSTFSDPIHLSGYVTTFYVVSMTILLMVRKKYELFRKLIDSFYDYLLLKDKE